MLNWSFDSLGGWEATSAAWVEGFIYRIAVCDDGTFDVSESAPELIPGKVQTFNTLAEAKTFCQADEDAQIGDMAVAAVSVAGDEILAATSVDDLPSMMEGERFDGMS